MRFFIQTDWQESIKKEGKKNHPNPVVLGFMIEQSVIVTLVLEEMKLSKGIYYCAYIPFAVSVLKLWF
jgi:hypothetical protein